MKLPKKSKYPKEVHIGRETYQIRFVNSIPGDKNAAGLCDDEKKIIYIQNSQTKNQIFRTYIHEMLHAAECEHRIKLKHEIVYQLEDAIGDFFLANF